MSNAGRNIGEDVSKIGMRWGLDKNGKATRKMDYPRHSYFYESLYKFLIGHIGKNFNETFSKFCQRFPKVMERYNTRAEFLSRFKNPDTERIYSNDFYVDDNGNIQAAEPFHKPRKQVKVFHDDVLDILKRGTPEYVKYKAEEKDRKNKEEREEKKLKEETCSTLLWSIEDKRRTAEIAKDIIDRDRLGFDDESFKGEFYNGQKRKKKSM